VRVTPIPGLRGTALITILATNANGHRASGTFSLVVDNLRPVISPIADQTTARACPRGAAVHGQRRRNSAADLQVNAASSNPNFVAQEQITSAAAEHRTIQVAPRPGGTGVTTITVTVTDADGGSATEVFQFNSGMNFTRFTEVPTRMAGVSSAGAIWGDSGRRRRPGCAPGGHAQQ